MVAIYEKLRPKTIDDIVGFRDSIEQLVTLRDCMGWGGQAFWITGGSGWGKTTLARIIATTVADEWEVEEIDAQELSLDKIRDFEKRCVYFPRKEAHAIIVNEAHTLNTKSVSRLQTMLEDDYVQRNGTIIFTTTDKGQDRLFDTRFDAFPFLSRCIMVELTLDEATITAMQQYLMGVADKLNLNGSPPSAYNQLLVDCQANMRKALQAIASGKMKVA
jgi:replication-associated recombination protein RarA